MSTRDAIEVGTAVVRWPPGAEAGPGKGRPGERVPPACWGVGYGRTRAALGRHNTKGHCHPRASSAKTRGFHTQLDEGPETP